jgi:hypothetical protein
MKRLLKICGWALILIVTLALPSVAQYTTVTGSKVQDANGNLLASGEITWVPTDANGQIINAQAGGGGQINARGVTCGIANGAITPPCQIADTSLTSPRNLCFAVTWTDTKSREQLGRYPCVQPSGATFDFDNYVPTVPNLPLGQTISYLTVMDLDITGTCTGCGSSSGSYSYGEVVSFAGSSGNLRHLPVLFFSLFRNGQRLTLGALNDFTISGTQITLTFTTGDGDVFTADYKY